MRSRVYKDPHVLVGFENADDAGVYLLNESTALVQTVDFFTPVVDDPYQYGQIAAANSLSDIYAMGASPLYALSIVGFPEGKMDESILGEIMRGGADKLAEAKVPIIGGHSVQDPEMKFGYSITGVVDPARIYTNSGAVAGDALVLTKPLGTGIITTGVKFGRTPPEILESAVRWMLTLNESAAIILKEFDVHAVTDITGYGLLGHAFEMAKGSKVTLHIDVGRVPLLPGLDALIEKGMLPGGIATSREYIGDAIDWRDTPEHLQEILLDPQTSGGLLASLPQDQAGRLADRLKEAGLAGRIIGKVTAQESHSLVCE